MISLITLNCDQHRSISLTNLTKDLNNKKINLTKQNIGYLSVFLFLLKMTKLVNTCTKNAKKELIKKDS